MLELLSSLLDKSFDLLGHIYRHLLLFVLAMLGIGLLRRYYPRGRRVVAKAAPPQAEEKWASEASVSDEDDKGDLLVDGDDKYQESKLVLLIRQDLEMSKGKIAAQCCHAVLAAYKYMLTHQPKVLNRWEASGQPKVTLKVKDEAEMLSLMSKARETGLCAMSIKDAGRTQIAAGSRTVAAIGPGPISLIDYITGHLKLY